MAKHKLNVLIVVFVVAYFFKAALTEEVVEAEPTSTPSAAPALDDDSTKPRHLRLSCPTGTIEPTRITLQTMDDSAIIEVVRAVETENKKTDQEQAGHQNDKPLNCIFEISTKDPSHQLSVHVANFLAITENKNCTEASIAFYDSQAEELTYLRRRKALEICPPSVIPPMRGNVTSQGNAFIVEIFAKRHSDLALFEASVTNIGASQEPAPEEISEATEETIVDLPQLDERASLLTMLGHDSGCKNLKNQSGMSGSFSSLSYPCPYGPRLFCVWDITVPPGMLVMFSFNKIFYVEPGAVGEKCPNDHLSIYKPAFTANETDILVRRYCGKANPKPLYLNSHRARVVFQSDDLIDGYGFRLHWAAVTLRDIEKMSSREHRSRGGAALKQGMSLAFASRQDAEACAVGSAGVVLTGGFGYLATPNFNNGGKYTPNTRCSWIITGNADQAIVLYVLDFKLEASANCSFDSLEIYDGTYKIGRFCATMFIPPIISKTNKLLVNFTSDSYVEDLGFKIFYRIVPIVELARAAPQLIPGPVAARRLVVAPVAMATSPPRLGVSMVPPIVPTAASFTAGQTRQSLGVACGKVSNTNFGAAIGEGCHGTPIHDRWMITTTNCLTNDMPANLQPVWNATNWVSHLYVGSVGQIFVKGVTQPLPPAAPGLPSPVRPPGTQTVGIGLVHLTAPATGMSPVCLPTFTEDDDTPDQSCMFPTPLTASEVKQKGLQKLSNRKCAFILRQSSLDPKGDFRVATDQTHFFECYLVRDLTQLMQRNLTKADDIIAEEGMKFCKVTNPLEYRSYFNQFPLQFCRNYDDLWAISGVLVNVLTSSGCGAASQLPVLSESQTVAVFVRASHFINWFFSVIGVH